MFTFFGLLGLFYAVLYLFSIIQEEENDLYPWLNSSVASRFLYGKKQK